MNTAPRTLYPIVRAWLSTSDGKTHAADQGRHGLPNINTMRTHFEEWVVRDAGDTPKITVDADAFGTALAAALLSVAAAPPARPAPTPSTTGTGTFF